MISIIAPVFNVEKYLNKFFESIINQTYEDWELIIVTDCPTDNSINICIDYANKEKRIKVIKQEKNQGVAKARNRGIENATGDYIMLVDSDDYLPKNALEILMKLLIKENADMAIGGYYLDIEGEIKKKKFKFYRKVYNHKEAIKNHLNFHTLYGYPWGKLFRKEVLKDVKDPEDMSSGDDGVFSFRALMNTNKIAFTTEPVYYYRIRRDSLSGHWGDFQERDLDVIKQVNYITECLKKENFENYLKDLNVFIFALYEGVIQKYLLSSNKAKEQYKNSYLNLKRICDNKYMDTIFYSTNIRLKLKAIKYKFRGEKHNV